MTIEATIYKPQDPPLTQIERQGKNETVTQTADGASSRLSFKRLVLLSISTQAICTPSQP